MSGVITTHNTQNVTRQVIYTTELQQRLQDWLVGMPLFNDRTSEFGDGDEAIIDQVGQRAVRDYMENSPIDFANIDTDRIRLAVTEYVQDGFAITDKAKQDAWKADQLWAANVNESALAFERNLESAVFETANQQTLNDPNVIAGHAHRTIATGPGNSIALRDIARMKLAFDIARVPAEGRVLFIDPTQEFALNQLVTITEPSTGDINNFKFEGIVQDGFGNRLSFIRKIYGINIAIAHNLPRIASETIDGETVTDGVLNVGMSMASADHMPFMGVIRQQPTGEFYRNVTMKRDEWSMTARYGHAIQRPETLYTIISGTDVDAFTA